MNYFWCSNGFLELGSGDDARAVSFHTQPLPDRLQPQCPHAFLGAALDADAWRRAAAGTHTLMELVSEAPGGAVFAAQERRLRALLRRAFPDHTERVYFLHVFAAMLHGDPARHDYVAHLSWRGGHTVFLRLMRALLGDDYFATPAAPPAAGVTRCLVLQACEAARAKPDPREASVVFVLGEDAPDGVLAAWPDDAALQAMAPALLVVLVDMYLCTGGQIPPLKSFFKMVAM